MKHSLFLSFNTKSPTTGSQDATGSLSHSLRVKTVRLSCSLSDILGHTPLYQLQLSEGKNVFSTASGLNWEVNHSLLY